MQSYFLLIISITFAVVNSCIYHNLEKKQNMSGNSTTCMFNSLVAAISAIMLICFNRGLGHFSSQSLFWGIVYGIVMSVFMISKMSALTCGPIAITALIGSCALVIPTLFGVFYYNENVTGFQVMGFVLLMVALILCCKFSGGKLKYDKKWIFWCLLFFTASGAVSIVFKLHQMSDNKLHINEMMITAYMVSMVILFLMTLFSKGLKTSSKEIFKKEIIPYVLLCAIAATVYNRLNIYLAGALPSIVFFPIFNGSIIFITTVLGIFLYKEKLQIRQMIGIIIGTFSIMLIGNIF